MAEEAELEHDVTKGLLNSERPPELRPQRFGSLLWLIIAENILIAIALLVLWNKFVPPHTDLHYQVLTADNKSYPSGPLSWSQYFDPLPCGKTPEEARARGCEFDMLVTAWLPPRCIDRELVDEFMEVGKWDFYTQMHAMDQDKLSTYDPDYIGSVNMTIWTTRSWHLVHCLFMFKKLSRALANGWTVDGEAVSDPHTEHCTNTFYDEFFGPSRDPNEIIIFLEIIYPSC